MEELRLTPYDSWGEIEQYGKDGSREFFLQWEIGQTNSVFFDLAENTRPIVHIYHFATKYVGEFLVKDHHPGGLVAIFG